MAVETISHQKEAKGQLLQLIVSDEAATRLYVAAATARPKTRPGEFLSRLLEKHLPSVRVEHDGDGAAISTGSSTD